jgi:hypothetical protein
LEGIYKEQKILDVFSVFIQGSSVNIQLHLILKEFFFYLQEKKGKANTFGRWSLEKLREYTEEDQHEPPISFMFLSVYR